MDVKELFVEYLITDKKICFCPYAEDTLKLSEEEMKDFNQSYEL